MRFTHIDVNFDVRYEGHQNCPKILSVNILRVSSDHHLWRQNWLHYLWTSLCQFIFFVNLLHSLGVWFFDIWHLFDNLTSFWQLDIFLTFWVQIAHGPHCPYSCTPLPMWPIADVAHTPCTPDVFLHDVNKFPQQKPTFNEVRSGNLWFGNFAIQSCGSAGILLLTLLCQITVWA